VLVVAAYGLILPPAVLSWPRVGCLNIHASLLPRWRGAAPIQHAILAGDAVTGVTIMQMDAGLDTGPMISTAERAIHPSDTAGALTERLAGMGAAAIVGTLARLRSERRARRHAPAAEAPRTPRRSTRARRCSTGRRPRQCSSGRCARSIPRRARASRWRATRSRCGPPSSDRRPGQPGTVRSVSPRAHRGRLRRRKLALLTVQPPAASA
jgi:methionyl-tRNA formyltransferase